MEQRISGALVICAALYSLWMGLSAVLNAPESTNNFVDLAALFEQSIDRSDFLLHWRVTYLLVVLGSLLALLAGVAMVLLKRWSCALLAAIFGTALLISVVGRLVGYTHYGFEGGSLRDLLILLVVAIIAYLGYRKWPQQTQ
jgi:hypothetical protein